ncbi:2-amino-4-hydroxy-6-hydroxymethyldihydropteridine diphosphokinase [Acidocella aminolytica]|uniref:2-amino-4-hydroxy-6-hydroxymethyldihydropteridine pyrophosphokinase n=1 Tax=Acidocella aminolytica 101 = DSM 11237 TaxID=1120923 RepID=A0A0D6PK53_9PROT|nr:2-amino-4-hydroxy-6-hydroxymethyldihydropteridine diphosphokinase [Acidocella aminolytica]GAN81791.1 2-amino-4-hydroxy-6-hydroxymethyldihydropteridine pyrophosphokinase [Acidocella aminolytica 101 = DSM 11237]GBQ35117.1 2-amino-4-hydroxy-6-hydroxymethyldihydropteridine pyrophosphokinase [Acidocella aminolytica 101 = DSM 11237]SHE81052.1 2-amino-4-hydroxy-6-hydroxymethyldihydropteridinediphosphokinase [Acidocella aminolytica 101 = DSM 11237]
MILIAIGANLPGKDGMTPLQSCEAAAASVRDIPGLSFVAQSTWYRTQAVPVSSQPDYCNGMIRMAGAGDPAGVLRVLQEIELRFGRERSVANAARTLDLDIIDMNGMIRATPDPVLPHPRAHQRAFVLRPLLDVAPGWRHPVLRQNITTLLADLPPQKIEPWHDAPEANGV